MSKRRDGCRSGGSPQAPMAVARNASNALAKRMFDCVLVILCISMECENHFYLYVLMCMACWRFGKAEGASDRACYACACVRVCAHICGRCKQAGGTRGAIDVMSRSWFPARHLTWARPTYKYLCNTCWLLSCCVVVVSSAGLVRGTQGST